MGPADALDEGAPSPRLELAFATPKAWALAMRHHVDELLVDQAHLEKKAAAAAVAFLFRLPSDAAVQRALSSLAREELIHFERTLRLLAERRIAFAPLPPCAYAARLKAVVHHTMPERLVDELLVAAIIEARSGERMRLLAEAFAGIEPGVARFYAELADAEARHEDIYAEIAAQLVPRALVARRLAALVAHEAAVLHALPATPRLHGGVLEIVGGS